jgi:hypothetical protein
VAGNRIAYPARPWNLFPENRIFSSGTLARNFTCSACCARGFDFSSYEKHLA